jgi:hypothetical protein
MNKPAGKFREQAERCREIANQEALAPNREQLLRVAETWDRLAEQAERMAYLDSGSCGTGGISPEGAHACTAGSDSRS